MLTISGLRLMLLRGRLRLEFLTLTHQTIRLASKGSLMSKAITIVHKVQGGAEIKHQVGFGDLKVLPGKFAIEQTSPISIRCPHCRHEGSFEAITAFRSSHDINPYGHSVTWAIRRCPLPACSKIVFATSIGTGHFIFPSATIDFDSNGIPSEVLSCMEESISCFVSGNYRASALMIRRTLEIMCEERGAEGKNLSERLKSLRSKVVLPEELMEGIHHLRILGNDAAHVEARAFANVGEEEVDIAVSLAKEILKATYQYSSLVDRLKSLAKA
jgi:Domain of unknown function (DUF4145)